MVKSWKMFKERTLMQWHSLDSFRLNLDDEPTENDLDGKTSREKELVNAFEERISKMYAMIV